MQARPGSVPPVLDPEPTAAVFGSRADHAECRRLHRKYGSTYYFATQAFPARMKRRVHALYGFVRVPDEWVDNGGDVSPARMRRRMRDYRAQLLRGLDGVRPEHAVLRAFVDTMREVRMPLEEPLLFLDAMEADFTVDRYATYDDLLGYIRGSATAVGLMMCHVIGAEPEPDVVEAATALAEAMQMTNFLRDVGEDWRERGRIYMPQDELARFGVTEEDIARGEVTERWREFMRFQIARTRALYDKADLGIPLLPRPTRRAVRLARILYCRILDRIEERDYDSFSGRARTSRQEKLSVLARVAAGLPCR